VKKKAVRIRSHWNASTNGLDGMTFARRQLALAEISVKLGARLHPTRDLVLEYVDGELMVWADQESRNCDSDGSRPCAIIIEVEA
jgi:hypothetical protein